MSGRRVYMRRKPLAPEKFAITAAFEKLISEVIKPRFLPAIQPTAFNYPAAIYAKLHGNKYCFIFHYSLSIR
jgi:hypothetical protein